MFPPVDSSRRGFLSQAAGLAAGGTALALATVTPTPAAALPADPVYAAIEAHEKAYAAVRAACAESDRLCELADKIAGKYILDIPDLRTPSEKDTRFYILPVAYQQNGIDFFEAPLESVEDGVRGARRRDLRDRKPLPHLRVHGTGIDTHYERPLAT